MTRRLLAAVLVALGLFAIGVGLGELGVGPSLPSPDPVRSDLPYSTPVRISIPTIGVRASVEPVGRAADGAIGTPPLARADRAGWYEGGPAPGEPGASVIVGHVDDRYGPAVFYRLRALRPGALVEISRRDRRVAVFVVDTVREYPKRALPLGEVFSTTRPALRLITCGGKWVGGRAGYADNVVVFATLTG